jgi:tRNA (guanine-N7-)-methyltransferase
MFPAQMHLVKTREIAKPTAYVAALGRQEIEGAFDEERAEKLKGQWRELAFQAPIKAPLDVEIGTGNGFFFAHRALSEPGRLLLGLEIKFKPLVQAIRRALGAGAKNARIARYHAGYIQNLFTPGEIENVFIHHPDPWTKKSKTKRRLMNRDFLTVLFAIQKSGSFLEFKTDSREYFFWAVEEFKHSPYRIERYSESLHQSEWRDENFVTHFERIYLEMGQPIYYLRARNAQPFDQS